MGLADELEMAVTLRDRAILELLYGSGLRVGEVCGLTTDRVDLERGRVVVMGKGSKERYVPLSDTRRLAILSTGEDVMLNGVVGATDVDGDALAYAVTGAAAHGTVTVDGTGAFVYTPAPDYNGPDSFTVTVSDGHGGSDTAVIGVTVVAVNDPPTITALADTATNEDTATQAIGFTVSDVETPAADKATYNGYIGVIRSWSYGEMTRVPQMK